MIILIQSHTFLSRTLISGLLSVKWTFKLLNQKCPEVNLVIFGDQWSWSLLRNNALNNEAGLCWNNIKPICTKNNHAGDNIYGCVLGACWNNHRALSGDCAVFANVCVPMSSGHDLIITEKLFLSFRSRFYQRAPISARGDGIGTKLKRKWCLVVLAHARDVGHGPWILAVGWCRWGVKSSSIWYACWKGVVKGAKRRTQIRCN